MNRLINRIGILILLGILSIGSGSSAAETAGISRLKNEKGRVFNYTATKLGLPVLKATIKMAEERIPEKEKSLVKVQALFQSNPALEVFFRMNNRFTSILEAGTYAPVTNVKEIDQGGLFMKKKHYLQTLTFDPLRQKVVVEDQEKRDRQEITLPPGTYDPLTIFARFYLRESILPGQDIRMSIFDGQRLRQIVFHSYNKEKIKSKKFGEMEAILLESKTFFSTFGDQEGTIRIWYSADARKAPVIIEADLPVGLIHFDLDSIEGD